eukprot:scaffold183446_cov14-Prasinocladus_malaysianus.AAC.1
MSQRPCKPTLADDNEYGLRALTGRLRLRASRMDDFTRLTLNILPRLAETLPSRIAHSHRPGQILWLDIECWCIHVMY